MNQNNPFHIPTEQAIKQLTGQGEWNPELRHVAKESFLQIERRDLLSIVMILGGPSDGKSSPETSVDALLGMYSPAQLALVLKTYTDHVDHDNHADPERNRAFIKPLAELRKSWS
jgi:hypothetical protein